MKNPALFHLKAMPVLALLCVTSLPKLPAQDVPIAAPAVENGEAGIDEALASLGKAAEMYVGAFNSRDAAAIASLFSPLGKIVGRDGETLVGRLEIEEYYQGLFAGEKVPLIALEVSDVDFIAPGVAIEEGQVHLTLGDDEPVRSVGYIAIHAKQADGSWLIATSRSLSEVPTPSEQLKPLHWLIGEWTLESNDGMRIDMVLNLDESENYLLGDALFTDVMKEAQTINVRIGWNPATSSIFWWTFDSDGGNASGPWSRRGDEWIVHTTGISADAEATASSQTLARDGDTMIWNATHRMLSGEARPDLIYRFVRRAPDPLSLLAPESAGKSGDTEPAPARDGE